MWEELSGEGIHLGKCCHTLMQGRERTGLTPAASVTLMPL